MSLAMSGYLDHAITPKTGRTGLRPKAVLEALRVAALTVTVGVGLSGITAGLYLYGSLLLSAYR